MGEQQQRDEKVWVDGVFIYEHHFPQGGSVLNCSVDAARLIAWLNQHKDEAGRVKFKIQKKLNANKAGSHSAFLDTWRPKTDGGAKPQAARDADYPPFGGPPDDLPL